MLIADLKDVKKFATIHGLEIEYWIGQKVSLSTGNFYLKLPRKPLDGYIGIIILVKYLAPTAYRLDLSNTAIMTHIHFIFYINLLWEFSKNSLHQQLAPIEVEGEAEYEVEAHIGYRLFRGQAQSIVFFIGFDTSENM